MSTSQHGRALTEEQNVRAREALELLLARHDNKQKAVADLLDTSAAQISRVLSGKGTSLHLAMRIAKELGWDLRDILEGRQGEPAPPKPTGAAPAPQTAGQRNRGRATTAAPPPAAPPAAPPPAAMVSIPTADPRYPNSQRAAIAALLLGCVPEDLEEALNGHIGPDRDDHYWMDEFLRARDRRLAAAAYGKTGR